MSFLKSLAGGFLMFLMFIACFYAFDYGVQKQENHKIQQQIGSTTK